MLFLVDILAMIAYIYKYEMGSDDRRPVMRTALPTLFNLSMEDKMDVTIIADNGHAWGIVSVEQLKAARLSIDDISDYSYKTPNGEILALEEDCDLPKYLNKLESMGTKFNIRDNYIPDEEHPDNPRTWNRIR